MNTRKTKAGLLVLALVGTFGLAASIAGESDHPDCGVCKPLMDEPGLMQHMRWDSRKIATGMISVTTVDPEFSAAFERAHGKMMQAVLRLENGEQLELCPMCTRMSALAQAGATIENVNAGGTRLMAITSQAPEVIAKIHAHVAWVEQEFSKHAPEHGG